MHKWWPLVALSLAQFVMVLDQSVMNVSISTLVDDFDTTVTTIQAVITLYCLVMAMFMLTGGKIGEILTTRPRVVRSTRSLIFITAEVTVDKRCIAMANGVFKILKNES